MSPLDAAWRQLISALHGSGRKAALAITGGGSGAVGELLRVPGGSRLLIEAQIPYDAQALAAFLGSAPAQACSADTAIAMAQSARARAARLVPSTGVELGADLVGLGATAALVSDRPRKGEHRFHIAFANAAGIAHCTCVLAKGRRDRAAEEDLVSRAIVLWLARACGIAAPSPQSLIDADEHYAEAVVRRRARGRGSDRSALGGRSRSRHRPARWPNDAVGAAALCCCSQVLSTRCTRDMYCWRGSPKSSGSSPWHSKSPSPTSTSRRCRARRCDAGSRNSPGSRRSS